MPAHFQEYVDAVARVVNLATGGIGLLDADRFVASGLFKLVIGMSPSDVQPPPHSHGRQRQRGVKVGLKVELPWDLRWTQSPMVWCAYLPSVYWLASS